MDLRALHQLQARLGRRRRRIRFATHERTAHTITGSPDRAISHRLILSALVSNPASRATVTPLKRFSAVSHHPEVSPYTNMDRWNGGLICQRIFGLKELHPYPLPGCSPVWQRLPVLSPAVLQPASQPWSAVTGPSPVHRILRHRLTIPSL